MSYPEQGASYRHKPKFMDRALAEEHRATGGPALGNGRSVFGGTEEEERASNAQVQREKNFLPNRPSFDDTSIAAGYGGKDSELSATERRASGVTRPKYQDETEDEGD